jgi:large subunit ribosomal protein L29
MELQKIRNLSDEELKHHEKTTAEQLFRLRFQVAMGQNDGVKKLRQLRKEIAQVKTVARERELGIHGETRGAAPAAQEKTGKIEQKPKRAKKTVTAETKAEKAKGARK